MSYNKADLIRTVAERLGAAGDGQDPVPEDVVKIEKALASVVSDLDKREVFAFVDLEMIEDAAFDHLSAIIAGSLCERFGLTGDELSGLVGRAQLAEQRLRIIRSQPYSRAPAKACFF